jgi:plastocyanin
MRPTIRVLSALSGALLGLALALPASAATQASIVDCSGQPGCFSPNPLTVPAGTSVTWRNNASLAHTATSDSGAWSTGVLAPGQTSSAITFSSPGSFTYHCSIHPSMHGTIVVTAAASPTPTQAPTPRALASGGGGPQAPLALALGLVALSAGLALLLRRRAS